MREVTHSPSPKPQEKAASDDARIVVKNRLRSAAEQMKARLITGAQAAEAGTGQAVNPAQAPIRRISLPMSSLQQIEQFRRNMLTSEFRGVSRSLDRFGHSLQPLTRQDALVDRKRGF